MNKEIPDQRLLAVEVEVVYFNIFNNKKLNIGSLAKRPSGKYVLPHLSMTADDEQPIEAALRVLREIVGISDPLHSPALVDVAIRSRASPILTLTYAVLGEVPNPIDQYLEHAPVYVSDHSIDTYFEEGQVIHRALDEVIDIACRTSISARLLLKSKKEDHFTIPELRKYFEVLTDNSIDAANFRRKVLTINDFLIPVRNLESDAQDQKKFKKRGRKPVRYRAGEVHALLPEIRFENEPTKG